LGLGATLALPQPADALGGHEHLDAPEVWFNADGFRTVGFAPNGWAAVAAMPGADSDVTLRIHAPSNDPLVAFRDHLATSASPGRELDFVLLDFEALPGGAYDVGVSNAGGVSEYQMEVAISSVLNPASPPVERALGPNELLDVFALPLDPGPWLIRVRNLGGGADLSVAAYEPGAGAHGRPDHIPPTSILEGEAGEDDTIVITAGTSGDYGLVVYKVRGEDAPVTADYRIEFSQATDAPPSSLVSTTRIASIQPNPFNPRTTVHYELHEAGRVELRVFNLRGECVRTLVSHHQNAGRHEVIWDGTDDSGRAVSSGVYLAALQSGGTADTGKMVLLK
jgi:hypothetical protein